MKPQDLISRHNFFLQASDVLFQQTPFAADPAGKTDIRDVRVRHERQTLRRLPRSKAILFTVRTYLLPVVDLQDEPESVRNLYDSIKAMPQDMAAYKGWPIWGDAVSRWCEEVLGDKQARSP